MSLQNKCEGFTRATDVKKTGLYAYFSPVESPQNPEIIVDGHKLVNLASNNYLSLTTHPKVMEAAIAAVLKYGTGTAGSPILNGYLDLHKKLELKLAHLVGKEAAIVFATGFQCNSGAIPTLIGRQDYIVSDKLNHASIQTGSFSSRAKVVRYIHADMGDLERSLESLKEKSKSKQKLLVVDGVFSMEGDIANLPEICRLAEKYDFDVMVDDAHAIGVLPRAGNDLGAGTSANFGVTDQVDIIMGTFSKSLASQGGFIASSYELVDYLRHEARQYLFSASSTPSAAAAALAALDVMKEEPERIERLWRNTEKMKEELDRMGYNTGVSETPIIPLHVGDMILALKMRKQLFEKEGILINPIVTPAVPENDCLIRTSFMADHTDKHLDYALEKLEKVGKQFAVI